MLVSISNKTNILFGPSFSNRGLICQDYCSKCTRNKCRRARRWVRTLDCRVCRDWARAGLCQCQRRRRPRSSDWDCHRDRAAHRLARLLIRCPCWPSLNCTEINLTISSQMVVSFFFFVVVEKQIVVLLLFFCFVC